MKNIRFQSFFINMKRNPERKEFMSSQLNELGIDFEIQEGIDGLSHDFSKVYDENLSIKKNGHPLTSGEKGCALSHMSILKKCLRDNLDYALVMEDDVQLPHNFKQIIEQVIEANESNPQWEYLSFNYPYVGIRHIRLWLYLFSIKFEKEKGAGKYLRLPIYFAKFLLISVYALLEGIREVWHKKNYKYGKPVKFYRPLYLAGCYLVSKNGMKKLLSFGDKIIYPADRIQNVARIQKNLRLYAFCPMAVPQRRDKFKSTLNELDISSVLDILV